LVVVFVALPLLALLLVVPLLFAVFGDGYRIAPDSPGSGILEWWDLSAGREITVGVAALVVLLVRKVFPPLALALAALAGIFTLVWFVIVLFASVAFFGGSLE
jgi:hypothetical protein